MKFKVNVEDVPEEIEAEDLHEARGLVNSFISIMEAEEDEDLEM